ncbi:MAG: helix-turn-helix transcriptional regulator [Bacilli bacterium]|nr:helix-turn-helix transcriptional regulator [Bacilli bacterium]
MMILGSRIKSLRKSKGLTQSQLANLINVTKVSICCYEKGNRTPNLDTFMDLVNVLDTTPNYLLGVDTRVVSEED